MTAAPGAYFCVSTHDVAGALIRFGTRNHWNHAGVFLGAGQIVEASTKGASIGPVGEYGASNDLIANYGDSLTSTQRQAIVDKARSLDGTPYGFLDIVALALYSSLGLKVKWLQRRVMREDRMICSQLVAACYKAAGIDLVPGKSPQEVTPADLANRIARLNGGN